MLNFAAKKSKVLKVDIKFFNSLPRLFRPFAWENEHSPVSETYFDFQIVKKEILEQNLSAFFMVRTTIRGKFDLYCIKLEENQK